jgi:hypothetical protein
MRALMHFPLDTHELVPMGGERDLEVIPAVPDIYFVAP